MFGVLLYVYFGHTSAGNAARQVLRRDPSGRTLLWGNVAAMIVAGLVYALFVIAVNGSVPPGRLAAEAGTAIAPLAEVGGPLVGVLGSIYVLLSLGIGAAFMSLGLYLQTLERVTARVRASRSLRSTLSVAPVMAVFAVVVMLVLLGESSFTGPLNLVGALILPLLGGVFPMLLVAAARRRGERVPGTSLRWLGHPAVVALVTCIYLGGLVAHALFIWTDPVERIVAGATTLVMIGLIVVSIRRRSFTPRTVVELRADEPPGAGMSVSVVADGRAVSERRLPDLAGLSEVAVDLPPDAPGELYVWAHRPSRDGDSHPLPITPPTATVDEPGAPEADHRLLIRPQSSWLEVN
ncbi:hypothetical protein BH23CHL7_BH23CHL7_16290 [soil metagenome]